MTDTPASTPRRRGILGAIGPAIITASVVLGPGSIVSNSNVGAAHGFSMVWVLALACALMMGMTALSARLGANLDGTLCQELTNRAGRPLAAICGLSLFLIASCFQFGNNLGVAAALGEFMTPTRVVGPIDTIDLTLIVLNIAIIAALFGFQRLYSPVEKLMMVLVGIMLVGFAGNLFFAKPDPVAVVSGLKPTLPDFAPATLLGLIAMLGTTFSVAGAFYQSYLVQQKGLQGEALKQGLIDTMVGIGVLGLISLMIMVTAGAVLYNPEAPVSFSSAAEVARQLEPLFGPSAKMLFCLGLFAGAFSSFLVNAMIAGSMLSDGVGLGGNMDKFWPKIFTVFALLMGMVIAIVTRSSGEKPLQLILFAQSVTVLGNPVLSGALLWLATRPDMKAKNAVPNWLLGIGVAGFLMAILLASRTAYTVFSSLTGS